MTLLRHLAVAVVVGVVIVILSVRLDAFRDYQIAEVACYVVAVAGLTVLVGLSGQISIGNGAFMAIGAYAAALMTIHLGWPLEAVLVASAAIAALGGAVVGVAAARLRGPYLAGATLMLAVALPSLATKYAGVFGGDQGLSVSLTVPGFLGPTFPLTRWQAWLTCAAALITLVLLANLARSRVGRSWRAVRDDEAGALLAVTTSIVSPGAFTLTLSIALLTAAVLGGLGSLAGAVWGSLVLVLVPTYITDVAASHGLSSSAGSNIPVAAYGVVLIVVMLLFPDGIQGALRRLFKPMTPDAGILRGTPRRRASASEHQEEGST